MIRIVSAVDLVASIPDGAVILLNPLPCEEIYAAFSRYFQTHGRPGDLTLVWTAGLGAANDERKGLDHFALPGMLTRVIYGSLGHHLDLAHAISRNYFEAFSFPQGVLAGLLRMLTAGRPGLLTSVGLDTFVDPLLDGGCMNKRACQGSGFVERIRLLGEDRLFYTIPKPDIGILRGTTIDVRGNLSCEGEALLLDPLAVAMAVKQAGGKVYAQALQWSDTPLMPHQITIPAPWIDGVVMASSRIMHPHTYHSVHNIDFMRQLSSPSSKCPDPLEVTPGRIICRRALSEIRGCTRWMSGPELPDEFPCTLMEESDTIESLISSFGVVGGFPLQGDDLGASLYPTAFLSLADTAAYCEGGMDAVLVPLGYVNPEGDVNTSYPGSRPEGCGSVVELVHAARKVVFCGHFMADTVVMDLEQGHLCITTDGRAPRFTSRITHRTFSAAEALRKGQTVLYITERCVIRLTPEGLLLEEVAPGIDIQKDILDHIPIPLLGTESARIMNPGCFR